MHAPRTCANICTHASSPALFSTASVSLFGRPNKDTDAVENRAGEDACVHILAHVLGACICAMHVRLHACMHACLHVSNGGVCACMR